MQHGDISIIMNNMNSNDLGGGITLTPSSEMPPSSPPEEDPDSLSLTTYVKPTSQYSTNQSSDSPPPTSAEISEASSPNPSLLPIFMGGNAHPAAVQQFLTNNGNSNSNSTSSSSP